MTLNAEAGLVLLALGLYVYDSLMLLRPDQFVLVHTRRGWLPRFGAHGWKLRGREPFVPFPLAPWQAVVRVAWAFERGLEGSSRGVSPYLPAFGRAPRAGVAVLMLLMFVALPIALFRPATAIQTVSVFAAIYVTCGFVLLSLRRDAARVGLSKPAFWKLCVECMACPPFCINAIRRASLASGTAVTLQDVQPRLAQSEDVAVLRRQLLRRVREQIDLEPETSDRMARLSQVAASLQPEENE